MADFHFQPLVGDQEDTPERDRHYAFAHHRVPGLFSSDPDAAVLAMLCMDETSLRNLWFEDTSPEQPDPPVEIGLTCVVLTVLPSDMTVVLFTLPKPWFTTGAYFVAAALSRTHESAYSYEFRLYTLERTVSSGQEEKAILGSWDNGRHSNYGPICEISRAAFLEAVIDRMDPMGGEFVISTDLCLKI